MLLTEQLSKQQSNDSVNPENVPRIKNGRCWKNDGQRLSGQGDFFQKGSLHMNADFSVLKKKKA